MKTSTNMWMALQPVTLHEMCYFIILQGPKTTKASGGPSSIALQYKRDLV